MLATTASATAAARLHRILKEHGIFSEIIGTPAALTSNGCSYSLRISDAEPMQTILHMAAQHGIKIRAIWIQTGALDAPYRKVYG